MPRLQQPAVRLILLGALATSTAQSEFNATDLTGSLQEPNVVPGSVRASVVCSLLPDTAARDCGSQVRSCVVHAPFAD
jgi:hypothetical protein